jgi:hypothetical protein
MQTVLRNAVAMGTKPLITPWGPVTANHVDFGIGSVERCRQIVKQVEDAGIVLAYISGAVIA